MYRWALIMVFGTLAILAYQHYAAKQQQQLQLEQENLIHQQDKAALDVARATNTLVALEQFIFEHPQSPWLETAVYYREKMKLQQVVDSGDIRKLQRYVKNNPDSEWLNIARKHIKKLQREQENKEIQRRIQADNTPEYLVPKTRQREAKANHTSQIRTQEVKKKPVDNPNERIQRALSIYQNINKQQRREQDKARDQRQREEKLLSQCNRLKDQLKQFKPRTRWYELDKQGNRVFIDKDTMKQRKQAMQDDYNRYCQG